MSTPLVSICCITYNHAPYIRECLDGFLMQKAPSCVPADAKMSDWCEILIHDDCSTDGTTDIVKEYAAKYPDLIFPLYEEENQYSKGKAGKIDLYNYERVRGKYIAYCEGDDYWTESLKLKKQVDFLELHSEYGICFHGFLIYDCENNTIIEQTLNNNDLCADCYFWNISKFDLLLGGSPLQPLTMVFRFSAFRFDWHWLYMYYRDTHEIYHILNNWKGAFLNFCGAVYHKHMDSITNRCTEYEYSKVEMLIHAELYKNHKSDKVLRKALVNIVKWNFCIATQKGCILDFWKSVVKCLYFAPSIIGILFVFYFKRMLKHIIYGQMSIYNQSNK